MIVLGSKVKDKITGFTGIATGRTSWLYGCDRYLVRPQELDKDGKPIEAEWIDEPQLEVIEVETIKGASTPAAGQKPGGPQNDPRSWR